MNARRCSPLWLAAALFACARIQPLPPEPPVSIAPLLPPEEAREAARRESNPLIAAERAWLEGNDRSFARTSLERGLASNAGDPQLLLRRALLSRFELDRAAARRDLVTILERAPRSPEAGAAGVLLYEELEPGSLDEAEIQRRLAAAPLLQGAPASPLAVAFATLVQAQIEGPSARPSPARARGGWLSDLRAVGPLAPPIESSLVSMTRHEAGGLLDGATWHGLAVPVRELQSRGPEIDARLGGVEGLYVVEAWILIAERPDPQPQWVTLLFPGLARLSIDGSPAITRRADAPLLPALETVQVELDSGWHRISLAYLATGGVLPKISILSADGQPAIAGSRATPPSASTRSFSGAAAPIELELFEQARALLASPRGPFARALAGVLALSRTVRDLERARSLIRPLDAAAPRSGLVALLEGRLRSIEGLPESQVQARHRRGLQFDAENPALLINLAHALDDEDRDRDQALALADRARAAAPRAPDPDLLRLRILSARRWYTEAEESLRAALEKSPTSAVLGTGTRFYRNIMRVSAARALEEQLAARTPRDRAQVDVQVALRSGDLDRAVERLAELGRWSFRPTEQLTRIADLELGRGRLEAARAAVEQALAHDPWDPRALRLDAVVRRLSGDSAGALLDLDRLRALGASDFDLEIAAAEIAGRTIGQVPKESWLGQKLALDPQALARQPIDPRFRDAQRVRQLERTVDWVQPDGHVLSLRQSLLRLLTKEATDVAGEFQLPGASLALSLRTLKSDGRVIDVDRHEGKEDLSFSALAPGDTVEKQWLSLGGPRAATGGYLRTFLFQGDVPYERVELLVVVPRGVPVWWHAYHGAPAPEVHHEQAYTVYRFAREGVPGIPVEPSAAPFEEFLPFVAVAVGLSPDEALAANATGMSSLSRSTWDVRALARSLTKGIEDPAAKLEHLARWLNKNVRAGEVQEPHVVLATRRGNRTGLLVAMARAVGLDARVVFARPGSASKVEPAYPDPGRYSDLLAWIALPSEARVAGRVRWARDLESALWLGGAPPELRGGAYLLPDPSGTHFEPLAFDDRDIEPWKIESKIDLEVALSGDAAGTVSMTLPGQIGLGVRAGLRPLRAEDRRRALEAWLASVMPGAALLGLEVGGLEEETSALTIQARIAVPSFFDRERARLVSHRFFSEPIGIKALGIRPLEAYIRISQRKMPLSLPEAAERMVVRLRFAPGSSAPTEAPESFEKHARFAELSQVFRWDDREKVAELIVEQRIPAGRISVQEFPAFRDFVQEVTLRARNQLVLPVLETAGKRP